MLVSGKLQARYTAYSETELLVNKAAVVCKDNLLQQRQDILQIDLGYL